MGFIKKTELFFIQLNYCLVIDPEPLITTNNGFYSLLLDPEIFFKLINGFNIEYPFIPENKIIELKTLMINENIKINDTLKIIQNFKDQYWGFDSITMFEPLIENFKKTHKIINKNITEKELNIELYNYGIYLKAKRDKIYFDLIYELNTEFTDLIKNRISTPKHENIFCNNGFELFNHIFKEYVKPTKGRQSDLIFYHRKMYDNKPQYIHQRPTEFFNWFENNYDEVFGQLKTLSQVETPQRNKDFSNALDWFKQQPQQVP